MAMAIDKITEKYRLSREQVTEMVRRTRTYLLIAQNMCLGYLLVMGSELS
jgi:Mor family transcriptional regulator